MSVYFKNIGIPFAGLMRPDTGDAPADTGSGTPPTDGAGDAASGPSDIEKLKEALRKERELRETEARNRAAAEARLKEVGNIDPRIMEEAERKAAEAERQRLMAEQEFKLRTAEMERKYGEEAARRQRELEAERQARIDQARKIAARDLYLANKGRTDAATDGTTRFDLLWDRIQSRIRQDDRGDIVIYDGDTPMLDTEGDGGRIPPAKFFEKLRDDPFYGEFFEPRYGSGGGGRRGADGRFVTDQDLSKLPVSTHIKEAFSSKNIQRQR